MFPVPAAGRKPKPEGQARHRVKPTYEWTEVPNVAFEGRKLPAKRPDGRTWPKWTRDWWRAVSTMPHCALWSEGDWRFAIETALVAAQLHEGDMKMATELRNREKVLGTTVDYRRDLRIKYVDPEPEQPDTEVTRLDDYRDL